MNGTITCSINEAIKLMSHLSEDTMVTLTIVDKKTKIHNPSKRIKKRDSKKLLTKAEMIEYQDNDFFGRFSLYGTVRDKNIIQNILFPQLEWEYIIVHKKCIQKYYIDKYEQMFYSRYTNKNRTNVRKII